LETVWFWRDGVEVVDEDEEEEEEYG